MNDIQCPNGHSYRPNFLGDTACPYCSTPTSALLKTVPNYVDTVSTYKNQGSMGGASGERKTENIYSFSENKVNPIVGWLVCEKGPSVGKDYRIVSGRNFIGRAQNMSICLEDDQTISRESQAVISYNPRKHSFTISPGESSGLAYLNGDEVLGALELKPYDRIELGKTQMVFVPFCGPHFTWPTAE